MALLLRIDVDRPYGKSPFSRHLASRISSDLFITKLSWLGYLRELTVVLNMINSTGASAHVFFRRCTFPTDSLLRLLEQGNYEIGFHLEDSRCYESFLGEKTALERHIGKTVRIVSKHGSGGKKYGRRHYAPYEPERYIEWAGRSGMKMFFGNLEDPTINSNCAPNGVRVFPAAFWLEPPWRDVGRFPVSWLQAASSEKDIPVLIHPENVLGSIDLIRELGVILSSIPTRLAL